MTEPQFTKLGINALFPVYIFCKDFPDPGTLNPALEQYAYDLRNNDPSGRPVSTRKGWQSRGDLNQHEVCRPLIRFIESTMVEIKQFMNAADSVNFFVRSCWANINPQGSHNVSHIHGNTFYSGVYYVKTPEDSGLIEKSFTSTSRPPRRRTAFPRAISRDRDGCSFFPATCRTRWGRTVPMATG
jgi:uncharacterized protein (TIGR02466 family)